MLPAKPTTTSRIGMINGAKSIPTMVVGPRYCDSER